MGPVSQRPGARPRPAGLVALVPLVVLVLVCGRCVCGIATNGMGNACEKSTDCYTGLVCVHLDEDDLGTDTVCVVDVAFDKTECTNDEACQSAGLPVDAFCAQGLCSCEDLLEDPEDLPSCPLDSTFGRFACGCVRSAGGDVGDVCEHPEQCASLICRDGECADQCADDNDCGGPTTTCGDDGACS